jgi:hypothetical protein
VADTSKPAVEERLAPAAMVKIINPVLRAVLASPLHGIASKGLLVLHVRGRRTGKVYDVPVGRHDRPMPSWRRTRIASPRSSSAC